MLLRFLTIYSHSSGGDGTDPLNGVTPDTTTSSNTWVAGYAFNADDTAAADKPITSEISRVGSSAAHDSPE